MRSRILFAALIATLVTMFAVAPAASVTEGEGEAEVVEEDPGSELGIEPAVEAPPEVEEAEDRPWTQRFLAPTVLALGVLGLIGSIVYYGVRVRGKYRVAQ